MQNISWTTDPYHAENKNINNELISILEPHRLYSVRSELGRNITQYIYYLPETFMVSSKIQDLIDSINYPPLTLTVTNIAVNEVEWLKLFAKALVVDVMKLSIETVESTIYEDYTLVGSKNLSLTPHTPEGNAIYVRPSEMGYYLIKCDPTPFRGMILITSSPLFWLALSEMEKSDPILRSSFTVHHQGNVIGIRGKMAIAGPSVGFLDDSLGGTLDNVAIKIHAMIEGYEKYVEYVKLESYGDESVMDELAEMWDIEILAKFPSNCNYIFYRPGPHDVSVSSAISDINLQSLPMIHITGEWVQTVEPTNVNQALLKYAALKAYTQLVLVNTTLAPYLTQVYIGPDLTISVPLSCAREADSFLQLFLGHLEGARFWSYEICENKEIGLLKRWKILTTYSHLTPIVMYIWGELFLVIDTSNEIEGKEEFEVPAVTLEDREYLKAELNKFLSICHDNYDPISLENITDMNLEQLLSMFVVKANKVPYCFSNETLAQLTTPIHPINRAPLPQGILFHAEHQSYSYYGYYQLLFIPGLLPYITELTPIAPHIGTISVEAVEDINVVNLVYPSGATDTIFEIEAGEVVSLEKTVTRLWRQGWFLTEWASSYLLYKHKLSSQAIRSSKILGNATYSPAAGENALHYLEHL